jgi:hypothetical protein
MSCFSQSKVGPVTLSASILGAQLERFEPLKMLPNSTQFCLNCFVEGDQLDQTFPVEVLKTKNVGILKDLIKQKKASDLCLPKWGNIPETFSSALKHISQLFIIYFIAANILFECTQFYIIATNIYLTVLKFILMLRTPN